MPLKRRILLWMRALRAPFFVASAMPVVVGTACAWHFGAPRHYAAFAIALVGVVALHAGANLANDYFDHLSGSDAANPHHNPFSGGSRVIQEGLIPARSILTASILSFAIGAACGAHLAWTRGGWEIPVLGAAGLVVGLLYAAPPARLSYRGLGELGIFVAFGPLTTSGAYFVQAGQIGGAGFWCGVPVGLLVALILLVNEFPDCEGDERSGKKTLIVRLGLSKGLWLVGFLYSAVYVSCLALVATSLAPRAALWTLATLPVAAFCVAWLSRYGRFPRRLIPSSAAGVLIHFLSSAILAAAYAFG